MIIACGRGQGERGIKLWFDIISHCGVECKEVCCALEMCAYYLDCIFEMREKYLCICILPKFREGKYPDFSKLFLPLHL